MNSTEYIDTRIKEVARELRELKEEIEDVRRELVQVSKDMWFYRDKCLYLENKAKAVESY